MQKTKELEEITGDGAEYNQMRAHGFWGLDDISERVFIDLRRTWAFDLFDFPA